MATLSIRKLPEQVHHRLRLRAAQHGRSMEAEARAILSETLCQDQPLAPEALQAWVAERLNGVPTAGLVDDLLAARRAEAAADDCP